jgi:peptidyl-prolyl cis-trans isomerase B (cyclophilin B)
MGLIAVILVLVIVGALGDKYYTARMGEKSLELEKQEAFAQGMPYDEYLRLKEEAAAAERKAQEAALAAASQQAAAAAQQVAASTGQPAAQKTEGMPGQEEGGIEPPVVQGQMVLPPPDLNVTDSQREALKKKAAIIHTTMGSIPVEFNADKAPKSVRNFIYLAESGYYDGMPFFREYPGAFVESGSSSGHHGSSPGYLVDMEYTDLFPSLGTLAFLPGADEEMVGAEFGIFLADSTNFEEQVAIFGRLTDRFDVVEKCADSGYDANGLLFDRAYITKVEIVDAEKVRPPVPAPAN